MCGVSGVMYPNKHYNYMKLYQNIKYLIEKLYALINRVCSLNSFFESWRIYAGGISAWRRRQINVVRKKVCSKRRGRRKHLIFAQPAEYSMCTAKRRAICGALWMFHYREAFSVSYRISNELPRQTRNCVCQILKTHNWNPLPQESCRPQIVRTNTFVSGRYSNLHFLCLLTCMNKYTGYQNRRFANCEFA